MGIRSVSVLSAIFQPSIVTAVLPELYSSTHSYAASLLVCSGSYIISLMRIGATPAFVSGVVVGTNVAESPVAVGVESGVGLGPGNGAGTGVGVWVEVGVGADVDVG